MVSYKAAAYGILSLALVPGMVGCFGMERSRPNTLPRRPSRPAAVRRPTEVTLPPASAMAKGNAPSPSTVVGGAAGEMTATAVQAVSTAPPTPVLVAQESRPQADLRETSNRVFPDDPPQAPLPVGPALAPPSTDANAPPPLPHIPTPRRQDDDDPAPPPIPSVVRSATAQQTQVIAGLVPLRNLHRQACEKVNPMDSYIARLRRREQINGKDKPEEVMLFKFRKQPFSVYFKWLGIEGHNREVIYVKNHYGDQIHTLLAEGDMPLMPAGKRIALAPDNIFVRARSRHAITEAGLGVMLDRFGKVLDAMEIGDLKRGTMKYLGKLQRPEFDSPCEAVEQAIPPGYETQLPKGGSRLWFFDPLTHFPVLLITQDHTQHEVEYYCYDRIQSPVRLDDDDFNPEKMWKRNSPK